MQKAPRCSSEGNPPAKTKNSVIENETKKFRISLFFDGTKNNRTNTQARLDDEWASNHASEIPIVNYPPASISIPYVGGGGSTSYPYPYLIPEPVIPLPSSTYTDLTYEERKKGLDAYHVKYKGIESYENDFTNVAKLEKYLQVENTAGFDKHFKIYIEGIGTDDLHNDSLGGFALGMFSTGIYAKVFKGIDKALEVIKSAINPQKIEHTNIEISLDAFGFSRGAAAARNFVYAALNTQYETVGEITLEYKNIQVSLEEEKYKVVSKPKICFVGLFDTVASYDPVNVNFQLSNTNELHLDSINVAENVFHLCSADEHRWTFPLTRINTSCKNNGKEIFLPGVHCDIGGAYCDNIKEINFPYYKASFFQSTENRESELLNERLRLIGEGWLNTHDMQDEFKNADRFLLVTRRGKDKKGIKNTYSRIPLHLMYEKFIEKYPEIKFNDLNFFDAITSELNDVNVMIRNYIEQIGKNSDIGDWQLKSLWMSGDKNRIKLLKTLRNQYFHFSSRFNETMWSYDPRFINGVRTRKLHDG